MTLIRAYLFNHKIVLPNVVQTADGFFVDESPVEVFEIAHQQEWTKVLIKKLIAGNTIIDTPDGAEEPGSAILDRLDITKWSTFELQALMYTVHRGARYVSIYKTGKGADGMWSGSATQQRKFDPRVEIHQVVAHLVQEITTDDKIRRPGTGLAVMQKDP